jgi:hypothetical protein
LFSVVKSSVDSPFPSILSTLPFKEETSALDSNSALVANSETSGISVSLGSAPTS